MYKNKVIKNIVMANYLLSKKCDLYKIDIDREDKSKLIFLFEKSDHLDECLKSYR